ncbi:MAG: hypothetical protein KZQ88_16865 [Candidatus Thiodiazotropha sp. (ex Dulcina madagascariensis)]|nr:hypothetical protein [Candidatus Thiodiazotropha sp. (ex Dulcina madagascariensis)]MCU7927234.1 hypothetical protein [Candidatus Thiodiazotropha sp. (ex Dulcina madagascariensis)]
MKKTIIVITISAALALTACGKPENTETSKTTAAPAPTAEQNMPALTEQQTNPVEQGADSGNESIEQTEQAAFEVGGTIKEPADTADKISSETSEEVSK